MNEHRRRLPRGSLRATLRARKANDVRRHSTGYYRSRRGNTAGAMLRVYGGRHERTSTSESSHGHEARGINRHHLRVLRCPRNLSGNILGHRRMNIASECSELNGQPRVSAHRNVRSPESFSRGLNRDACQLLIMATTRQTNQTKNRKCGQRKPMLLPTH